MDLLQELQRKLAGVTDHPQRDGIKAAIRHIELAEQHLNRGRIDGDMDAFNDVIYRTNQAFEGMLKEAYAVLSDKDGSKISPHEIEQYFLKEKKLTDRVMSLFRNYREVWRNPSTHDHRLVFRDEEGLLAIVSVSAFSMVLLDQIVETVNFKRQRAETERNPSKIASELGANSGASLVRYIAELLCTYADNLKLNEQPITEAQLIGQLSGFLVGTDSQIEITPEPAVAHNVRPDLLIERDGEKVIVQVQLPTRSERRKVAAINQVLHYLNVSKLPSAVLFMAPSDSNDVIEVKAFPRPGMNIWVVGPSKLIHEIL